MANVFVDETSLENIADAIRSKNGSTDKYKPSEMADAISAISGGGITPTGTKNITENGTHDVTQYASASVNVPNSYTSSDEGKVVNNGALVAQTSQNITSNGTVDTTTNDEVVVSVPNSYSASDEGKVVSNGALVAQTSKNITSNGTVDTTLNDEVVVNVAGSADVIKAEGDFTITTVGGTVELTHNLNTKKIAVFIYPTSKVTATGGYQNYYALYMNANELLDGKTFTFDFTSYNTHFSGDETVTFPHNNLRSGAVHLSPWQTQTSWHIGGNPADIKGNTGIELTNNTVKVKGASTNYQNWCAGTYHWIVWKLG